MTNFVIIAIYVANSLEFEITSSKTFNNLKAQLLQKFVMKIISLWIYELTLKSPIEKLHTKTAAREKTERNVEIFYEPMKGSQNKNGKKYEAKKKVNYSFKIFTQSFQLTNFQ